MIFGARTDSQIRTRDLLAYTDRVYRLLICALAFGASCYRPQVEGACVARCNQASAPDCPAGLTCGADGLCYDDRECNTIEADGGGVDDAVIVDTPPGLFCAGAGWLANTCPAIIQPAMTLPALMNTMTGCTEVIDGNCLFAAESIAVVGSVRVIGPRPLVLFARTNVNVATSSVLAVEAASGLGCPSIASGASAMNGADATGGGPGGTLGGRGGAGGGAATTVRATAPAAFTVTSVRGGCPGGKGGDGPQGGGGAGGDGGGAVYVIAGNAITIVGTIRAPGTGGAGASPVTGTSAGGGGGGSGGLIVLDAPEVRVSGVLHAGGGGGGGGARGGSGSNGSPATSVDSAAAGGFAAGAASSAGAPGSSLGTFDGVPAPDSTDSGGAGGGGGGAGVIKLFGSAQIEIGAKLAPPAT